MRSIPLLLLPIVLIAGPVFAQQTPDETTAAAPRTATPKVAGEVVVPRMTWRIRTLLSSDRLLKWRVGLSGSAFPEATFAEAASRTDNLSLNTIEGSSSEKASPAIQKNLDSNLTAEERIAVKSGVRNVKMSVYRTDQIGSDEKSRRQLFEFAKAMGADVVVVPLDPTAVAELDTLATEFGIKVALRSGQPRDVMKALEGRSKQLGAAADTGLWMESGVKPTEALATVKDRVFYVSLRDRSAIGASGHDVMFGTGAGDLKGFLLELNRLGLRPLTITLDPGSSAKTYFEVVKAIEVFETVVQPALGAYVTEASRTFPIRGLQNMPAEQRAKLEADGTPFQVSHPNMSQMNVNLPVDVREKIDAALPKVAPAKPKKPRKLLVLDACVANMSHNVIPHANYAIEMMGKKTGAYEPIFSNDFNNLKYPKIKEFDAIFLNSTVGELFPDPAVREGLTRFVREGGGLGLLHGATYASRNWPEFAEMVGAADGPHRVQPATLKVEYPESPITKSIGKDFRYSDEYYRFYDTGETAWLSRNKIHVLLSIDMAKTPDFNEGRPPFIRKDNDYPIAWIKSYGKGRVFNNAMGHTPEFFQTPQLAEHILAAIQFILGDVDDDTKPSGPAGGN